VLKMSYAGRDRGRWPDNLAPGVRITMFHHLELHQRQSACYPSDNCSMQVKCRRHEGKKSVVFLLEIYSSSEMSRKENHMPEGFTAPKTTSASASPKFQVFVSTICHVK
jgi:hypothetical protein